MVCNTPFITYPSKIKIGRGKYCSKKCCLLITAVIPQDKYKFKKGHKTHNFKGWRYCGRNRRYKTLYLPDHPNADSRGYFREHRYIMEQKIGRYLEKWEEVHHIDGNGLNNSPENLIIMKKSEHLKLEHQNGKYILHLKKLHAREY